MSGHSRWANIKHRKGKSDVQKGKLFTKLGREISLIVKEGGPDPEVNYKLRDVLAKAKQNNMPNDSIARSLKKASGDADMDNFEEINYEGYGPAGVAVIVSTLTDNRNRTAGEVRHMFDKFGGNLGTSGCVSFMFNRKGQLLIERSSKVNEDDLMMLALEVGAEDFVGENDYFEIITEPEKFWSVKEALQKAGYEFVDAEITMIPTLYTKLIDEKQIELMDKLIDNLEILMTYKMCTIIGNYNHRLERRCDIGKQHALGCS